MAVITVDPTIGVKVLDVADVVLNLGSLPAKFLLPCITVLQVRLQDKKVYLKSIK